MSQIASADGDRLDAVLREISSPNTPAGPAGSYATGAPQRFAFSIV
jgi:hypothetical protein